MFLQITLQEVIVIRIIVTSRRIRGPSEDKQILTAYETLVSVKNGLHNLRDYHGFKPFRKVEVLLHVNSFFVQSHIPQQLRGAILTFLQGGHTEPDPVYDCYAFANSYKGIPQHEKCDLLKHWHVRRMLHNKPHIGGVVFFMDDSTRMFRHAAIYVGHECYVSVYNAGGDLHFASFKDMQQSFGGKDVYLASPRT